jgi:hypothetical protein
MNDKSSPPRTTLANLQIRIREQMSRFEELRGFL